MTRKAAIDILIDEATTAIYYKTDEFSNFDYEIIEAAIKLTCSGGEYDRCRMADLYLVTVRSEADPLIKEAVKAKDSVLKAFAKAEAAGYRFMELYNLTRRDK